jgi:hypothetical protein
MLLYASYTLQTEVSAQVIQNCWLLREVSQRHILKTTYLIKLADCSLLPMKIISRKDKINEEVLLFTITGSLSCLKLSYSK